MPLHLDVVCDPLLSTQERTEQTVRVIGEILPFVLAKYGVGNKPARTNRFATLSDHRTTRTKPK
jgi:hypothetical protein